MTSTTRRLTAAVAASLLVAGCAPNTQSAPLVAPAGQPGSVAPAATSNPAPAESEGTLTQTQFGPISAVDRKLLSLVEETSLREMTTSQWALERSSNDAVKQAAQVIINQHMDLEQKDQDICAKLGLPFPKEPSPDMQVGINRMRTETGQVFDDDYVNTLRQAHAQALILVSTVRADTRNTLVRPYAGLANDYIKTHIELLEKTGDVDYTKLPVPQLQS